LKLRQWYSIAGLSWALVAFPTAGSIAFAFLEGIAWIFIFGDDRWPPGAQWVVAGLSIAVALVASFFAFRALRAYGRKREGIEPQEPEKVKAALYAAFPLFLFALAGAEMWFKVEQQKIEFANATRKEAIFAALAGAKHQIAGVDVSADGPAIHASVRLSGMREGNYRLRWRLVPSSVRLPILDESRSLKLAAGERQETLDFTTNDLAKRYQETVLNGGHGVLVDENFELDVSLDPVLTTQERADLPPGEPNRLGTTDSALHSEKTVPVPVRFTID